MTSIERWLGARLGDTLMTSDQEDIRVNCPFCMARDGRPDTKHHLYVSLVKPLAHCFKCSWKGHWMTLIISVEGCSYSEAMRYIETPSVDINRFALLYSSRGLIQVDARIECPDDFQEFRGWKGKSPYWECDAAYQYAKDRMRKVRGYTEIIQDYFGWIPGTNRLWMLVDKGWWQGRSITAMEPKYINPPWPIGDSLWNAGALELFRDVVICEGVFSAIHVGAHAIALCAKTATKAQASRIAQHSNLSEITIMLDADARAESYQLAEALELAGFIGRIKIHFLFKGDPCDSRRGEVEPYNFQSRIEYVLKGV